MNLLEGAVLHLVSEDQTVTDGTEEAGGSAEGGNETERIEPCRVFAIV